MTIIMIGVIMEARIMVKAGIIMTTVMVGMARVTDHPVVDTPFPPLCRSPCAAS
jgi:hypothetical protein